MFTSKQMKAIFDFFDANQKVFQTFYKCLLEKGIAIDENGYIIIESNEITRSLLCNKDHITFKSEKTLKDNKDDYWYEKPITYASFSVLPTSEQKTITSDGSDEVAIFKHYDELNIVGGALGKTSIVKFSELAIQHIFKIQNELNAFASHFGMQAPILQPITNFLLPNILNEQLLKDPSNMKLRDYGFTTIIAAAIKSGDYVILGNTHSDCRLKIGMNAEIKYSDSYDKDKKISSFDVQSGYITSDGEFVMPIEAWRIADKAGQIDESAQSFTRYSKDFFLACEKEFDIPYARQKIKENLELELANKKAYFNEAIFGNKSYEEKREMQNKYVKGLLYGMDYNISTSKARKKIKKRILDN